MKVCAICQNTNSTTRICEPCSKSKYNKGWVQTIEDVEEFKDDEDRGEPTWFTGQSPMAQLVKDLHVYGRVTLTIEVVRPDKLPNTIKKIRRRPTNPEIALAAKCSVSYVEKLSL